MLLSVLLILLIVWHRTRRHGTFFSLLGPMFAAVAWRWKDVIELLCMLLRDYWPCVCKRALCSAVTVSTPLQPLASHLLTVGFIRPHGVP